MELLDRYLHALKTFLPKAQERDIVAELSDSILSDVEEQEALLGRPLNRAEEVAVLKKYGHPLLAAGRYLPQQYLIGPTLYPYYLFALKALTAILVLGNVAAAIVSGFMSRNPAGVAGHLVGNVISAVVFGIGVVTVGFALLERWQVKIRFLDTWDPGALPAVQSVDAERVPLSESIFGLIFGALFLLYWLAVPPFDRIAVSGEGVTLRLAPIWREFYIPIMILFLIGIVQNGVNLLRPHWIRFRGVTRIVADACVLVIAYLLLRAGSLVLIIVDATGDPTTHADKAAMIGKGIAYGIAVTAAVFAVDLIINLWRLTGRPGAKLLQVRLWTSRLY
jgi:hypothetical protein